MRVFVTGFAGQLGHGLSAVLASRGHDFDGRDLELDIADSGAVRALLEGLPEGPPEVLVNAAALTQVDRCEREPELAERINAEAPAGLAALCAEWGTRLVHVSTDYVFDGESQRPYREDDPPAPRSAYGRSKLAGEQAVLTASEGNLVVRTSWVFGRGRNFVVAVLEQARKAAAGEAELRVVDDQRGRPTYANDLAGGLWALVEAGETGLYHLAGAGEATWWEVAREALDLAGFADLPIQRIATADLDLAAPRPRSSVLDCSKAEGRGVSLRSWREALADYLGSDHAPAGARGQ